ncbi:hypothetical protein RvY_02940 [Ramazzottius varieornatus]|uniref:MSP domain-containing protein n=1 Tax=Ramazzottius varieornatus TaxID=947166 RepID=A0A1D1ULD7_RAMVA|nr:hypothetical protein RvY_02940 [Ramazzottius varieornatus]
MALLRRSGDGTKNEPSSAASARELPVFTFPNSLAFYADDKDTLRQIMTVYNPYEFPIKFRVYSTAPKTYSVTDSQGTVKPGFCSDIVVRHNATGPPKYGHPEKFRIQIYDSLGSGLKDDSFGGLLGRKDIEATLYERRPISTSSDASHSEREEDGTFTRLAGNTSSTTYPRDTPSAEWNPGRRSQTFNPPAQFAPPSPVILLVALLCVVVLCLPTENTTIHSQLPVYLHLSINQKLVAAYILGLITMVILRA